MCPECRTGKKKPWWNWGVAVHPMEEKLQQGSVWTEIPKSTAKEETSQRNIRRIFKILREVWLNIRVEKVDTYKGITVKALLDSSAIGMFMNKKMIARHGFKL